MLVLTVRSNDSVYALLPDGTEVVFRMGEIRGGRVRVAIEAAKDVIIARDKNIDDVRKTHNHMRTP